MRLCDIRESLPFFEGPLCEVRGSVQKTIQHVPSVKARKTATEDSLLTMLQLVKAGYGSLREVKLMNTREVIQAMYYEDFKNNFEMKHMELIENDRR